MHLHAAGRGAVEGEADRDILRPARQHDQLVRVVLQQHLQDGDHAGSHPLQARTLRERRGGRIVHRCLTGQPARQNERAGEVFVVPLIHVLTQTEARGEHNVDVPGVEAVLEKAVAVGARCAVAVSLASQHQLRGPESVEFRLLGVELVVWLALRPGQDVGLTAAHVGGRNELVAGQDDRQHFGTADTADARVESRASRPSAPPSRR